MELSVNDVLALYQTLNIVSTKELITAAMESFSNQNTINSMSKYDILYNAALPYLE